MQKKNQNKKNLQQTFITAVNSYATRRTPFFFLIDFEMESPFVCPLNEAHKHGFYFKLKGQTNQDHLTQSKAPQKKNQFAIQPLSFAYYSQAFHRVVQEINKGNSYLLNLTDRTEIGSEIDLETLFLSINAPYTLYHDHDFLFYSPESFIQIREDQIYTYPMKGTIDASIPNAEAVILADPKEQWEHNTIVDLLRNDLAMVSQNVSVTRFRYVESVQTAQKTLLQVSSEIRGELPMQWREQLGELLLKLLPAGSISGAPKAKTVEIIRSVEQKKRGFYTGVFGIFDGETLDSGVNIRFIKQRKNHYEYYSGGGITAMSQLQTEYDELKDKIYVPTL